MQTRFQGLGSAFWILVMAVLPLFGSSTTVAQDGPTVGMARVIRQQVLPGPELEVRPLDDRKDPLVVRIVDVYPHGSDFRYDIEYYGLEPGHYDLRDYLRRKDGAATGELPPLPVTIVSALGKGQVLPHAIQTTGAPRTGGYHLLLTLGGLLWITGAVLFWLRSRHRGANLEARAGQTGPTLANRLQPLVESAAAGTIQPAQRAELERLLLGYWSNRLGVTAKHPSEALAVLKTDPTAGPLLEQLEIWLHRPGSGELVDVAALLAPYRQLSPDELAPSLAGQGTPTP